MGERIELLPVKSDFVFKLIFGDQRNVDILAEFLKTVLDIPNEEYDRLTIVDPYVKKESENDKYGILDVKVHTKNKSVVHVEIQVKPVPDMKERTLYSQSKMITEQVSSGRDWAVINRVVSIIITDYPFVPENGKYHNQFRYRAKDGTEFTGLSEINTLELTKLPSDADNSELWYWMKFIKMDNKEAFGVANTMDMLAERSPALRKAVGVLKELSADERTRMIYEDREKARRDIASMMNGARQEGINEATEAIARKLFRFNIPIKDIAEATGLTREQIEMLKID